MGGGDGPGGKRPPGMVNGRPPVGGQASGGLPAGDGQGNGGPGGGGIGGGPGGGIDSKMIDYLVKNVHGARWLVAVTNVHSASSIMLQTGKPVIAMGGFTGSDPAMTVAKLQQYVKEGSLRYLLLGGDNHGGTSDVTSWVQKNCAVVKASEYGGTASSGSSSSGSNSSDSNSSSEQLYRCGT